MPQSQLDKTPQRAIGPLDLQQASVLAIEAATSMISPVTSSLHALKFGSVSVLLSSDHAWQRLVDDAPLQPDLILMDWHVHPTPCEEFLRRLRRVENPRLAETAVICLIANADAKSVCAARDAGANAVLGRPFSPKQLGEKVLWVLEHDVAFIRSDGYVGPDRRHFRSGPYRGKERRRSVKKGNNAADSRTPA